MPIEQAIYDGDWRSRSAGFRDDWRPEAERLCAGFGVRPAGVACPSSVFARLFGPRHVAVVQVADRPDGVLAFRLLIVPKPIYADLGGDPFLIADAFPPVWDAQGELPSLEWTAGLPARRTIEQIQTVLNVPNSATLLGGAQALLDGGRLAFERTAPDLHLVRSLWAILPYSTRTELWPASFAFGNALGFDVAVVPRADGPDYTGYVFEEQAGDYPEGRYELALQIAVESGDQGEMDALFTRRSRSQTLRLAYALLAVLVLGPLFVVLCVPTPPRRARVPAPPAGKVGNPPQDKPVEAPR